MTAATTTSSVGVECPLPPAARPGGHSAASSSYTLKSVTLTVPAVNLLGPVPVPSGPVSPLAHDSRNFGAGRRR